MFLAVWLGLCLVFCTMATAPRHVWSDFWALCTFTLFKSLNFHLQFLVSRHDSFSFSPPALTLSRSFLLFHAMLPNSPGIPLGSKFLSVSYCCQAHQVCHSHLLEYGVTGCACLWNAATWLYPWSFSFENFLVDPDNQDFSFFACPLPHPHPWHQENFDLLSLYFSAF